MADWLLSFLGSIPLGVKLIIAGSLPVTELRAAIPIGIALGVPPWFAFVFGVWGNLIPVVPLLLVIPKLYAWLIRKPSFQQVVGRFIERTRRKGRQVEKYGALGLFLFVAVPLPGTGVWTGSILAFMGGINFWYSVAALSGGVIFAGIAVTVASIGFLELARYLFDLEVFAGFALCAIVCWWLIKRWKSR